MEPAESNSRYHYQNRGDDRRSFELSINFFLSKAKLADGSLRTIEQDSVVSWEVAFEEIDPQELVSQEEKAGEGCCGENRGEYCLGSRARSGIVTVRRIEGRVCENGGWRSAC